MPRVSNSRNGLLSLAVLGLLAGCSLNEYDHKSCTQASDCRQAFGFAAVCGGRGLCEQVAISPRCQDSYPDDLWRDPQRYRQAVVFGSLMDHASDAHLTRERAIRLAVKEANAAGGLEGRSLALVMCDIRESPRAGQPDPHRGRGGQRQLPGEDAGRVGDHRALGLHRHRAGVAGGARRDRRW